jgi:hypothetical protein
MLPEEVLGHALLYLVAAIGRQVVFRDPARFGAALYDEAWALLASPHGQKLLVEGVRDGRKHNGAIWLASQHPNDFAIGELEDLLGARFVFAQAHAAIGSALRFLGVKGSTDAEATLEAGLGEGQCLYRDVRGRVGLVQVTAPVLPELRAAFDTTPSTHADAPGAEDVVAERPPDIAATTTSPDATGRRVAASGTDPIVRTGMDRTAANSHAAVSAARDRARRRRRTPLATALAPGRDGP